MEPDAKKPAGTARGLNFDEEGRFVCPDAALTDELAANLALPCRPRTI